MVGGASTFRVTLPVEYRGRVAYTGAGWSAGASAGTGLAGPSFRLGGEQLIGGLALRGGAVYTRSMWNPTVGVGFPVAARVALDVAGFANTANIERVRRPAVAVSLRLAF